MDINIILYVKIPINFALDIGNGYGIVTSTINLTRINNMIEKTSAFKVAGQSFLTLRDAQLYSLEGMGLGALKANEVAPWLIENKDEVIDILTTTSKSLPKARKIHGGTKNRKPVVTAPAVNVVSTPPPTNFDEAQ